MQHALEWIVVFLFIYLQVMKWQMSFSRGRYANWEETAWGWSWTLGIVYYLIAVVYGVSEHSSAYLATHGFLSSWGRIACTVMVLQILVVLSTLDVMPPPVGKKFVTKAP